MKWNGVWYSISPPPVSHRALLSKDGEEYLRPQGLSSPVHWFSLWLLWEESRKKTDISGFNWCFNSFSITGCCWSDHHLFIHTCGQTKSQLSHGFLIQSLQNAIIVLWLNIKNTLLALCSSFSSTSSVTSPMVSC